LPVLRALVRAPCRNSPIPISLKFLVAITIGWPAIQIGRTGLTPSTSIFPWGDPHVPEGVKIVFLLRSADTVDRISVFWPSGSRQVVAGSIRSIQQLVIVEEP
jgi:hypothetical protein